jgi:tetratricopeptide (TPR) repeat protein
MHENAGQLTEAESAFRQAAAWRERHAAVPVFKFEISAESRYAWAGSLADLARFHQRHNQNDQAAERGADARTAFEQTVKDFPTLIFALDRAAWFLATSPVKAQRDPPRALKLVEKAIALDQSESGVRVRTLGVIQYRLGDYRAALDSFELSIRLENGETAPELMFFQAMARWCLGDKVAAHRDFDEAVRWSAFNEHNWAELEQFRDETATLMGLK